MLGHDSLIVIKLIFLRVMLFRRIQNKSKKNFIKLKTQKFPQFPGQL